MSRSEHFRCTIERDDDGQVHAIEVHVEGGYDDNERVRVNGHRAGLLAPALHAILRGGGVTGRQWSSSREIELDQAAGSQAWLLLVASKPLRRADRIDEVSEGVAAMSREEAAYWFAKAHQPRGLRAVRLLLSDDGRRR